MKHLPSDITSEALRNTYYVCQKAIEDQYNRQLAKCKTKVKRQIIVDEFKQQIQDTIDYYVNLCKKD